MLFVQDFFFVECEGANIKAEVSPKPFPSVLYSNFKSYKRLYRDFSGFSGGTVVKNLLADAGDAGDTSLIPGSGRCPGGGNGNPLQYSCLEIPWIEEPGWATVHEASKSWT